MLARGVSESPSFAKETLDFSGQGGGAGEPQVLPAGPGASTASPTHLTSALPSASRSHPGRLPNRGKSSRSRPPAAETPGEGDTQGVSRGAAPSLRALSSPPLLPTVLPTPPCCHLIRRGRKLNPFNSVITWGHWQADPQGKCRSSSAGSQGCVSPFRQNLSLDPLPGNGSRARETCGVLLREGGRCPGRGGHPAPGSKQPGLSRCTRERRYGQTDSAAQGLSPQHMLPRSVQAILQIAGCSVRVKPSS